MLMRRQWKLRREYCAAPLIGTDGEISPGDRYPFPHVGKSHAVRLHFRCLKAQSVILHDEDDAVVLAAQVHPDMTCMSMLDNIAERLLEDPIQRDVINVG